MEFSILIISIPRNTQWNNFIVLTISVGRDWTLIEPYATCQTVWPGSERIKKSQRNYAAGVQWDIRLCENHLVERGVRHWTERPCITYGEKGRCCIVRTGAMHFCGRAASPLLRREHGHGFSAFHAAAEKKEQTDRPALVSRAPGFPVLCDTQDLASIPLPLCKTDGNPRP